MSLNIMQQQAVESSASTLLLAGAGTGKTKTLVSRISKHIQDGTSVENILAVTFTNKAAAEMRERLEHVLNQDVSKLWMGTFHSIGFRLLVSHSKTKFKVISQSKQFSIIKRLLSDHKIDVDPAKVIRFINGQKDEGIRATAESGLYEQAYLLYEQHCNESHLMDFGELLLRSYELLRDNERIREHYKSRFDYILVDEFQDTNVIQYEWLRLLTDTKNNLFAVGDDDQSIYSFRGAKVENMTTFQTHYPEHQLIKLVQNYRCSHNILSAANAVIANNQQRFGKELETDNEKGEAILLYHASNEVAEAEFVTKQIQQWLSDGKSINDVAILYRTNGQSESLAQALLEAQLPYHIAKGVRFYDKQEIKIVLNYLQLLVDKHDDHAFESVVNIPARFMGVAAKEVIRNHAARNHLSFYDSSVMLLQANYFNVRSHKGLSEFISLIDSLTIEMQPLSLAEIINLIVKRIGLVQLYERNLFDNEERIENLVELAMLADSFSVDESLELSPIEQFLSHAVLASDDDSGKGVKLMTLHASKGLEFGLVCLVGLEEGLFPSAQSPIEEERRLMYVGITRAKQKLVISYAKQRCLFGRTMKPKPSRFIEEIPANLVEVVKEKTTLAMLKQRIPSLASYSNNYHPEVAMA
jgi:DNA helicase-2/ATP-dependent DNA helicase PcrA